jgi:hypothetical protein
LDAPREFWHRTGRRSDYDLIRIYSTRDVGVAVMGNATSYHFDDVTRLVLAD